MPRQSLKRYVLDELHDIAEMGFCRKLIAEELLGMPLDPIIVDLTLAAVFAYHKISNRRYFKRDKYRPTDHRKFHEILHGPFVGDSREETSFLFHYRMPRDDFWALASLVKDNPVFQSPPNSKRKQSLPEYQLLVLLKFLGTQGNQSSDKSIADHFGIGFGTVDEYKTRALTAIIDLESRVYFWPDNEEREETSRRIQAHWKFPHCIGLIDGTLLPLEFRPLLYGENYLSRKSCYAVQMLIVCDDKRHILYYHVGWPGSVHDNRVWRNCKLFHNRLVHFSLGEYLLGDSAFTPSNELVPSFKNPPNGVMSENQEAFNDLLSKPRSHSEHCIGLLKGRFQQLKNIRIKIKNKRTMQQIIKVVRASVILHNLLIETNAEYDEAWIDRNDTDAMDDDMGLARNLWGGNMQDDDQRQRLMDYFSEVEGVQIL
jgi:hypothetical protein